MTSFSTSEHVIDGVRVAVMEAGKGAPLVYFHGAGTMSGFTEILPLAEGRRLIVPIHPGFGQSEDNTSMEGVLDYVFHYKLLFDKLGLAEPVDIVGHSLGGWIGSMFAAWHPHRVKRMVLACPAGLRVSEHPGTDIFTIPSDKLSTYLVADPDLAARMSPANMPNEIKVQQYREITSLARVAWLRAYEPRLPRWLPHVGAPTLLLWGEEDRILPAALSSHWKRHLASSDVRTFPRIGHLIFLESGEPVKEAARFLAS
jgi:pimeloyl-ACP methyl ester carboxylesterase